MPKPRSVLERLERLSIPEPNSGCVLFLGYLDKDGYGRIRGVDGPVVSAHIAAYRAEVGPIPDGFWIDHLCRVRCCINTSHMEAVPPRINTLRGNTIAAAYSSRDVCLSGHLFNEKNTYMQRGARRCRTCTNEQQRRYQRRLRERRKGVA